MRFDQAGAGERAEGASRPRARADSTASARLCAPSLAYRLRRWVLTVLRRDGQLAGDLRRRQVGRQVAQHADLAVAERLERRPRPGGRRRGPVPGQQVQDLGDQGGVRGALPGLALEQVRCRVQQEPQQRAVGLGQIQRALQGAPGGGRVAERVPGDRLQQERLEPARTAGSRGRSRPGPARARRSPRAGRAGRAAAPRWRCASPRGRGRVRRGRRGPARHARCRRGAPGRAPGRPARPWRAGAVRPGARPAARRPGTRPARRRPGRAPARASRGCGGPPAPPRARLPL